MKTDCNARVVMMVIGFVGIATLLTIGGIIFLALRGQDVPEALTVIGGAALGGLTAMLTTTRTGRARDEEPVEVTTPENEPLEVTPVEAAPANPQGDDH
jgi:hypothetical protein